MKHHRRSAQVWHVFSRDFTVLPAYPHVHPQSEWAIPAFAWFRFCHDGQIHQTHDLDYESEIPTKKPLHHGGTNTEWRKLTSTGCLALYNLQLHVLDLYSHEQEVDFANDNVLQMVPDTGIITIGAYAINILDFCLADLHSPQVRPGPQNTFADHPTTTANLFNSR